MQFLTPDVRLFLLQVGPFVLRQPGEGAIVLSLIDGVQRLFYTVVAYLFLLQLITNSYPSPLLHPEPAAGELDSKSLLVEIILPDEPGKRFFHLLLPQAKAIQLFFYLGVTPLLVAAVMSCLLKGLFQRQLLPPPATLYPV